jgi:hypothetical protein
MELPDTLLEDEALIAEAERRCRLADGSACTGPGSDCTPSNCFVVEVVWREAATATFWPPQSPQEPAEAASSTATRPDASGASCGAVRGNLEGVR